jgi:putative transposase
MLDIVRSLLGALRATVRTHRALARDAPAGRAVQEPEQGKVIAIPEVGGLHHRCERRAA